MNKKVEHKIVDNKSGVQVKNQRGEDRIVVIEETIYHTFTNRRKGPCFFKRETGREDYFEGHQTIKDITAKERGHLMESKDFENGWLVEELDSKEVTEKSIHNKNTLNDTQLSKFVKSNLKKPEKMKAFCNGMTSEFAVTRFKETLVENDAPSSLVAYADYKLSKIEEEYLESKRAPIDKEKIEE